MQTDNKIGREIETNIGNEKRRSINIKKRTKEP